MAKISISLSDELLTYIDQKAERSDYRLGSIWIVTFDPSVGTEIRKIRYSKLKRSCVNT